MTIGTTLIGIGLEFISGLFPGIELIVGKETLSILILFLALLGIIIFNSIIGVRHDMLTYARTVNEIRNYFATKDKKIRPYLIQPVSSLKPSFWESPTRYFFWEVTLVAVVNSSLITFSAVLAGFIYVEAINSPEMANTVLCIIYIIGLTFCHLFFYQTKLKI